ncbi:MAG: hypothetical protein M4579_003335 [Chaenotheca gracillima]|nr:MAG: hypothetical protein M4579_003335 [Chaenotheca gracillima]
MADLDSSKFDESRSYKPFDGPGRHFNDGREIELLRFIFSHPDLAKMRGDPGAILGAIDEFGRTCKYLMNVGEYKGKIVCGLIKDVKPQVMVELGSYVGYSCLLFGATLRRFGGAKYLSLEMDPLFAAISTSLVNLAGLQDLVQVVVGPSHESLRRLCVEGSLTRIDLLFIDHHKPSYVPDLKLCEELRLVVPGSVIAADNVIWPGNKPYLDYVRSTVSQKVAKAEKPQALDNSEHYWKETIDRNEGQPKEDELLGNPHLIYNGDNVMSFEPSGEQDGLEISRCIGVEALKQYSGFVHVGQ